MQWWYDFVNWLNSDEGWRVITSAVIPAAAILVAGVVAAMIGRGNTKRILARHDREVRAAAITAVVSSATKAARWNALAAPEQLHADHVFLEADTRLRLLGVPGADLAADWSRHMIEQIKSNAVSFSFQAEQLLLELRRRLFDWQAKPSRAKKLFKADLESWEYEASLDDQDLVAQQHAWAAQQAAAQVPAVAAAAPAAPASAADTLGADILGSDAAETSAPANTPAQTSIRDLGFDEAEQAAPATIPAPLGAVPLAGEPAQGRPEPERPATTPPVSALPMTMPEPVIAPTQPATIQAPPTGPIVVHRDDERQEGEHPHTDTEGPSR